jgi:dihydrofolate reductase
VIVSLVAAIDRNRGIGIENRLPWRLSTDQKRFRELTMGHHIIVGRRTFESIGKALPGRRTIIVTRNENYRPPAEEIPVVHSVEEALDLARSSGETEVFVCGGGEIYARALPIADRMYLTFVEAEVDADAFFPDWDESEWEVIQSVHHKEGEKDQHPFTFQVLHRKRGAAGQY